MGAAERHRSRSTQGAENAKNARPYPEVCKNSACAGAEDGSTELRTVAVSENKQYRNRAKASLLREQKEQEEQDQEQ